MDSEAEWTRRISRDILRRRIALDQAFAGDPNKERMDFWGELLSSPSVVISEVLACPSGETIW